MPGRGCQSVCAFLSDRAVEAEEKAVVSGGDGEIAVDGGFVSQRSPTLQGDRPRL